jgi:hypothetical protein
MSTPERALLLLVTGGLAALASFGYAAAAHGSITHVVVGLFR